MKAQKSTYSFALCIRDDGSEDLEQRKLYQVLLDRAAERDGYIRIVDESGQDYLYPSKLFCRLAIARSYREAVDGRFSAEHDTGCRKTPIANQPAAPTFSRRACHPRLPGRVVLGLGQSSAVYCSSS